MQICMSRSIDFGLSCKVCLFVCGSECSVHVWCGWTVRAESVWTHYRLANVQILIGFTLRPFPLHCLMSSHVLEPLLPYELRRWFWLNENWHFGIFLRIQRFIFNGKDGSYFNRASDKKCVDKEGEVLPGSEYLKLLTRTLYPSLNVAAYWEGSTQNLVHKSISFCWLYLCNII